MQGERRGESSGIQINPVQKYDTDIREIGNLR